MQNSSPLLEVQNLSTSFFVGGGLFKKSLELKAVQDVSFTLEKGKTLGVVGESGCGKSTLGRCILQLIEYQKGHIIFQGVDLTTLSASETEKMRKDMQIIFQDPLASLDPRMTIGQIIEEPISSFFPELDKSQRKSKIKKIMAEVGLLPEMINRYPHEFSGGQAQRIGIARALVCEPKLIICDEPVSALDVSIQAQIINLLKDLQNKHDLALIFISHDLSIVHHISDEIAVLYLGQVIEFGDKKDIYHHPKHPYTQALISAVPVPDPRLSKNKQRIILTGELPSPLTPPKGCAFNTRCMYQQDKCHQTSPQLKASKTNDKHFVSCFYTDNLAIDS